MLLPSPRLPTRQLWCPLQDDVAGCFDYYAGLAEQLDGRQYEAVDVGSDDFKCALRREPLGVVGLITPWNYPRECCRAKESTSGKQRAVTASALAAHSPGSHSSKRSELAPCSWAGRRQPGQGGCGAAGRV
jgi:hypothetical protein